MSYVVGNPLKKESGGHSVEYEALEVSQVQTRRLLGARGHVALGAGCCTLVLYFIIAGAALPAPAREHELFCDYTDHEWPRQGVSYAANGTDYRIEGWKGIPFAEPPVGNLRWKMPEPCQLTGGGS